MRNPERIDVILNEIKEVWKENPDLRLGQLMEIFKSKSGSKADMFNIEDHFLLSGIEKFKKGE